MDLFFQCASEIPSFANAFDDCEPNYVFGEVEWVYISPLSTDADGIENPYPADVSDVDAWLVLFNADVAHRIPVKGSIDEPEVPEIETSLYRKAYPPPVYTLNVAVDDLSGPRVDPDPDPTIGSYEAMRLLNNQYVRMWFISGGYIFGGQTGLRASVKTWITIEEGQEALHRYHASFEWRSTNKLGPARNPAPSFMDSE